MTIRPPQHILSEILLRRTQMTHALATAIDHSFTAAERGCAGRPGEVDRLVYFFLHGLPAIEGQFNSILNGSGVQATLSGIFCHQTPRVRPVPASPHSPAGCELGDILFLVTYGGRLYSHYLGNALLMQAKEQLRSVRGTTQAHLYEVATSFDYSWPAPLAGQTRLLHDTSYALWYWGMNPDHWRFHRAWFTEGVAARPTPVAQSMSSFEDALMDLICGINGRRVKALQAGDPSVGWSKIVDDLIRVTAHSAFTRRNAYISRYRRPLRGEEITRVLQHLADTPRAPFLIRCSLDRIFEFFGNGLEKVGVALTESSKAFDADEFSKEHSKGAKARDGGASPPMLGNGRPEPVDGDNGGCSFVIIDFQG